MKMINITGQRGIGKTEVALRVAEYGRERYSFSRLLYVEFDKIPNCSEKTCLEKLTNSFNIAPASVFDIISHMDVESAVEVIRGSVRPEEKVFLIMDGVDQWLRKKREFLLSLVERLRQRLGDVLWIVLTSQQYVSSLGHYLYEYGSHVSTCSPA
jgi:Cdc6-like AAA superfamily ATPase